jgi:hypothetical protein
MPLYVRQYFAYRFEINRIYLVGFLDCIFWRFSNTFGKKALAMGQLLFVYALMRSCPHSLGKAFAMAMAFPEHYSCLFVLLRSRPHSFWKGLAQSWLYVLLRSPPNSFGKALPNSCFECTPEESSPLIPEKPCPTPV